MTEITGFNRVLAIDPCDRGFGFAVLEGADTLIDWGVKRATVEKNARCLKGIAHLMERYHPDLIVVEDCGGPGSRRCQRVRELIQRIRRLAVHRKVKVRAFSRGRVQEAFALYGARTKHQIANAIGQQFAELAPYVPPCRRCWMSEHYRTSTFDAVALGLAFFLGTDSPTLMTSEHCHMPGL